MKKSKKIVQEQDLKYGIEDLKGGMCKWPSGDPKHDDFHFCGAAAHNPDMPYCEFHARMAYRDSTRPEAAKPIQKKAA